MRERYRPRTERQRIAYLIEECGEVLAAAGKSIRWGYEAFNPEPGASRETNKEWLARELVDLKVAIKILQDSGDLE